MDKTKEQQRRKKKMEVVKMKKEEGVWKVSVNGKVEHISKDFSSAYQYALDIRRKEKEND